MNKYTPGPWLIIDNCFVYALSERKGRAVNRMNLQVDAGWNGDVKTSDDEVAANARLIAAAPELLEALEHWAYNPDCMDIKDLVAMSKEVIAKAKGETK